MTNEGPKYVLTFEINPYDPKLERNFNAMYGKYHPLIEYRFKELKCPS